MFSCFISRSLFVTTPLMYHFLSYIISLSYYYSRYRFVMATFILYLSLLDVSSFHSVFCCRFLCHTTIFVSFCFLYFCMFSCFISRSLFVTTPLMYHFLSYIISLSYYYSRYRFVMATFILYLSLLDVSSFHPVFCCRFLCHTTIFVSFCFLYFCMFSCFISRSLFVTTPLMYHFLSYIISLSYYYSRYRFVMATFILYLGWCCVFSWIIARL